MSLYNHPRLYEKIRSLRGHKVYILADEEEEYIVGRLGNHITTIDDFEEISFDNPRFASIYNDKFSQYEIGGWRLDNSEMILDIMSEDEWKNERLRIRGGAKSPRSYNECMIKTLPQFRHDNPDLTHTQVFNAVSKKCRDEKIQGGSRLQHKSPLYECMIKTLPQYRRDNPELTHTQAFNNVSKKCRDQTVMTNPVTGRSILFNPETGA